MGAGGKSGRSTDIIRRTACGIQWDDLICELSTGVPRQSIAHKWAEDLTGTAATPVTLLRWTNQTASGLTKLPALRVDSKPPGQQVSVPLFRSIVKLTSQHRHVLHLFSYAPSMDRRTDPATAITVVTKPKETGTHLRHRVSHPPHPPYRY